MNVAIQGERGSFHHEAAMRLLPDATVVPQKHFSDVFSAVVRGEAEYGLCAVENSLYGSINEVYRLLGRNDVWIIQDIRLHISQQLVGSQRVDLELLAAADDVRILSQAPAFAQVELWLDKHLPKAVREETGDTALSVQIVTQRNEPHTLAIAGSFAADTYNGVVIARDIQDEADNHTRFILFQSAHCDVPNASHASMILKTDHTPGSLLHALRVFSEHGCNLVKLDSHPVPSDQRHYAFYIDYELSDQNVSAPIIAELERQGCHVKLLGEYFSIG